VHAAQSYALVDKVIATRIWIDDQNLITRLPCKFDHTFFLYCLLWSSESLLYISLPHTHTYTPSHGYLLGAEDNVEARVRVHHSRNLTHLQSICCILERLRVCVCARVFVCVWEREGVCVGLWVCVCMCVFACVCVLGSEKARVHGSTQHLCCK